MEAEVFFGHQKRAHVYIVMLYESLAIPSDLMDTESYQIED